MPMVHVSVDSSTIAMTSVVMSVITFVFCTSMDLKPGVSIAVSAAVGIILFSLGVIPIGLFVVVGITMSIGILKWMFDLSKKRNRLTHLSTHAKDTATGAAAMVDKQLLLCRSSPDYLKGLHSDFVHGYLFGFFDASSQYANIKLQGDNEFFSFLKFGHIELLSKDIDHPENYAHMALLLKGNTQFELGQSLGGEEYFDYQNKKIRAPIELLNFFSKYD